MGVDEKKRMIKNHWMLERETIMFIEGLEEFDSTVSR